MDSPDVFVRCRVRLLVVAVAIVCSTASCSACSSSPRAAKAPPTTVDPTVPARARVDVSGLVVYQVWLNSYAYNPAVGQTSVDVFDNAATHLPAIAAMGVTAIQLSPVQPFGNESTVGATYSIKDYYRVNPGYSGVPGNGERARALGVAALQRYIDRAHALGLEVLMDCVYHSTEADNVLVRDHPDFYLRGPGGAIRRNQFGFAMLDYANPALRSYMIDMTKYWALTVGFDGCRADLATFIPVSFWAMVNNEMKRAKPGWLMIAEVADHLDEYGGTYTGPGYRLGERYDYVYAFDAMYGVAYMGALRRILNQTAPAALLARAVRLPDGLRAPAPDGTALYRGVDNHDQRPRAVQLKGGNDGMLAAMTVSFTIGGIPFIFNGQEIGDAAPTSLFSQTFIDWVHPQHPGNAAIFKDLISLTRTNPALARGTTMSCDTSDESRAIGYLRQRGAERVLVVVNLSSRAWKGSVALPPNTPPVRSVIDLRTGGVSEVRRHTLRLSLPPYAALIGTVRS
jgi:glycosidase